MTVTEQSGRRIIAYYRVSTRKQQRSGLGIDAQRQIVAQFAMSTGAKIVDHFTEHESGRSLTRPELQRALAACRLQRATLVVAKLDRLARNAAFLLSLRDSGVDLVACDMPSMNRMTVGIMAVVAEEEARVISERTRVALQAAKRRGTILGTPRNLTTNARRLGCTRSAVVRADAAESRAKDLAPIFERFRSEGISSVGQMAHALNQTEIRTPRGKAWTPVAVLRVLSRLGDTVTARRT